MIPYQRYAYLHPKNRPAFSLASYRSNAVFQVGAWYSHLKPRCHHTLLRSCTLHFPPVRKWTPPRHSLQELSIPRVEFLQFSLQFLLLSVLLEVVHPLLFPPLGVFHHFLPFTLQFLWRDLSVGTENSTAVNQQRASSNPALPFQSSRLFIPKIGAV